MLMLLLGVRVQPPVIGLQPTQFRGNPPELAAPPFRVLFGQSRKTVPTYLLLINRH